MVGLGGPDGFPHLWFGPRWIRLRPVHLALTAPSREAVDAVQEAAGRAGAEDPDPRPGRGPQYHPGYYGVFFRDPDGNNVEAVHHSWS